VFYKYRERDFEDVPAYELEKGDEICLIGNITYGAIEIEHVTVVKGGGVFVHYILPVGAMMSSSETKKMSISWEGNTALIQVAQEFNFSDRVFIRKKR